MVCSNCGRIMIWGSDFDSEDYGYDELGMVSNYSCECGATVEMFTPSKRHDLEGEDEFIG